MKNGHITVFFSLVLVIIISFLLSLLEFARLKAAEGQIYGVLDLGVDSLFAEYQRDLLEQFDLFYLDGSYGDGELAEGKVIYRLNDYISYNTNLQKDLPVITNNNLIRADLKEAWIEKMVLATDNEGMFFKEQAVSYMKEKLGLTIIENLLNDTSSYEAAKEAGEDYQSISENNERILAELELEKETYEETENGEITEDVKDDPLEAVAGLKKLSILQLVAKDPEKLSGRKFNRELLPSRRNLNSGFGENQINSEMGIAAQVLFHEYILEKMKCYTDTAGGGMAYEAEYIIGGKDNDMDNLETVVHRILLIREGINFLYLMTDAQKREEAFLMATALVGAVPVPGLIQATQAALLLAWAYGESIIEVRELMAGGRIAVVKTRENWRLSLSNLAGLTDPPGQSETSGQGMDYKDYLRLLLFTGDRQGYNLRSLDVIETRIRAMEHNQAFKIDTCISHLQVYSTWDRGSIFTIMSGLRNEKKSLSEFDAVIEFSY